MLVIPGQSGKDLCDQQLGITRRDLLRVGGSAVLGADARRFALAAGSGRRKRPSAAGRAGVRRRA